MTEVLFASLLIMIAIASWMAWKLDRRTYQLFTCEEDWKHLHAGYSEQTDDLAAVRTALADLRQLVEKEGAGDIEVQRLRKINLRLADRIEELEDLLDDSDKL